jgi:large subunit ribosomal protein L17
MRHGFRGRKFNRTNDQRRALFAGLAASLIKHEQIRTTLPKAKDLAPVVDRLITMGKKGSLHHRRLAFGRLRNDEVVAKLFGPLADRYRTRNGGYTRVVKAGFRQGDAAPMAIIELVDRDPEVKGKEDRERAAAEAEAREEEME